MKTHLAALIDEGKAWLDAQGPAEAESDHWYSLGNFSSFIKQIEADPSPQGLDKAMWGLTRHITDQLEWSAEYCKDISSFLARAREVRRSVENG